MPFIGENINTAPKLQNQSHKIFEFGLDLCKIVYVYVLACV